MYKYVSYKTIAAKEAVLKYAQQKSGYTSVHVLPPNQYKLARCGSGCCTGLQKQQLHVCRHPALQFSSETKIKNNVNFL